MKKILIGVVTLLLFSCTKEESFQKTMKYESVTFKVPVSQQNISHYDVQFSLDGREYYTVNKFNPSNKEEDIYIITINLPSTVPYDTEIFFARFVGISKDGVVDYSEVITLNLE